MVILNKGIQQNYFLSLSNESLGEESFCYKRKDNKQSSEVMLQETLLKVFSEISSKSFSL